MALLQHKTVANYEAIGPIHRIPRSQADPSPDAVGITVRERWCALRLGDGIISCIDFCGSHVAPCPLLRLHIFCGMGGGYYIPAARGALY